MRQDDNTSGGLKNARVWIALGCPVLIGLSVFLANRILPDLSVADRPNSPELLRTDQGNPNSATRTIATPQAPQSTSVLPRSEVTNRLDNVERDLIRAARGGDVNLDRVEREIEVLERDARRQLDAINRRPGQSGYSLEERRAITFQLLRNQGYSEREAVLAVQDMERHGLLPDPPRSRSSQPARPLR